MYNEISHTLIYRKFLKNNYNMTGNFYLLPLMLILLSSGVIPYSHASVESEAQEDLLAGCRSDQTLVYRFAYQDYVCVEPSTAQRWTQLGFAEIKQEATSIKMDDSKYDATSYEEKYPGAPPPPPTKSSTLDNESVCRDGQVLFNKTLYQDSICVNLYTAMNWERLGLGEIIDNKKTLEVIEDESETLVEDESETLVEDESETLVEDESETLVEDESETSTNLSEYEYEEQYGNPIIYSIEDKIWAIVDDKSSSIFIEGDSGIIMIDSLSSYSSMEKVLNEFKSISDQKVKIIIFTKINSESVLASSAVTLTQSGEVEMILSDELLYEYSQDYDLSIENVVTYPSQSVFTINVGGVNADLFSINGFDTEQTFISLPDYEKILVGDSKSGIFPSLLDVEHLEAFSDQQKPE
jgi:hypothetical protein